MMLVGGNESRTVPKWTKKLAERGATVVGHYDYQDGSGHLSLSGVDFVVIIKDLLSHRHNDRVVNICAKQGVPAVFVSKDWARAAPILCHKAVIEPELNGAPKPSRAQVEEAAVDLIVDIRQNEGREPSLAEVSQIMQQTFRLPSAPGYSEMRRAASKACHVVPPQRTRDEDRVDPTKFLVALVEEFVRDDPSTINTAIDPWTTVLVTWFDGDVKPPTNAEEVVRGARDAIRARWWEDVEERRQRIARWIHLYSQRLWGNRKDGEELSQFDILGAIDAAEKVFGVRIDRFEMGAEADRQRAFMTIPDIGDDIDDVLSGLFECGKYYTKISGFTRSKEWIRKRLLREDFPSWRIPGAARGRDVWVTTKTALRAFFFPPMAEDEMEEPSMMAEIVPNPTDEVAPEPTTDEASHQIDEWVDLLREREQSVKELLSGLDEATGKIKQTFATFRTEADSSLEGARDKLAVQIKTTLEITENLNQLGKGVQAQARELTSRLDTYASALAHKLDDHQDKLVGAFAATVGAEVERRLKVTVDALTRQFATARRETLVEVTSARDDALAEISQSAKGLSVLWEGSVEDARGHLDDATQQAVSTIRGERVQVSPALALMEAAQEGGMGFKLEITPPAKGPENQ